MSLMCHKHTHKSVLRTGGMGMLAKKTVRVQMNVPILKRPMSTGDGTRSGFQS